jgi:hypothetical protein
LPEGERWYCDKSENGSSELQFHEYSPIYGGEGSDYFLALPQVQLACFANLSEDELPTSIDL